jgi:AraC-like DNA-binding protein
MGNARIPRGPAAGKVDPILPVRYAPPGGYRLDLEIVPSARLREQPPEAALGQLERIEFHLLVFVAAGRCVHLADFEPIACAAGSLLALKPGQVHRFDLRGNWRGWLILFRPEFLQPALPAASTSDLQLLRVLDELPVHMRLRGSDARMLRGAIERMAQDARIYAESGALNALLRSELQALVVRLHLLHVRTGTTRAVAPLSLERFRRFRAAVEREFQRHHRVADYAKLLGCSEKSLVRAVREAAGVSAKRYVSQRVALEAKRLLSHTSLPVAVIADRLGFDEPTNFVKFFRRDAGAVPGEFRRRALEPGQSVPARRPHPGAGRRGGGTR